MVKRRLTFVSHPTMTHWMLQAKSESSKFVPLSFASFEIHLPKSQEFMCVKINTGFHEEICARAENSEALKLLKTWNNAQF